MSSFIVGKYFIFLLVPVLSPAQARENIFYIWFLTSSLLPVGTKAFGIFICDGALLCLCLIPSLFSGRVRYKFASFWNRNHTLKALQRRVNNYHAMLEVEKKVSL